MINIAICDDEIICIEQIKSLAENILRNKNIIHNFNSFLSGEALIANIKQGAVYDIVFMDISMGKMNGISSAKRLREYLQQNDTILIYISSFDNRAKETFCFDTHRFLSKPIDNSLFKEAIITACAKVEQYRSQVFSFKDIKRNYITIEIKDILYFSVALNHRVNLFTYENKYTFYDSLSKINMEFEKYDFLRIHHSYLVNFYQIKKIAYDEVKLMNEDVLPISGPKRKYIKEKYLELSGK